MSEIHDPLYSISLLVSLVCGGAAALWDVARMVSGMRELGSREAGAPKGAPSSGVPGTSRASRFLTAVAVTALALSVVVHARWGHGPASSEPMGLGELFSAHPAFLWVAMLLVFAGLPAKLLRAWLHERRGRSPR